MNHVCYYNNTSTCKGNILEKYQVHICEYHDSIINKINIDEFVEYSVDTTLECNEVSLEEQWAMFNKIT